MPRTWRSARGIMNLRAGRNDWYRITNLASGSEVSIYDEIGYLGVSAHDFISDLSDAADPITLRLHTPGGEVFDGIAIYHALQPRQPKVRIEGLAASIGSVIAMAAAPGQLEIARRARMMIHDGFSMAVGNAADMRALADQLDEESDNIAGIYADRTGKPASYWRELMRAETWYDGQKAVDAGLADRVMDTEARPQNTFDLSVFSNAAPAQVRNDGVDHSSWDADRAWHNGAASDDPAAFYKAICAGRKAGDPSEQSSWALPYKYTPSSPPNAAGVRNALSRLPQTEGLTNKAEAQALLERLMKQVNPDYDPDDLADPVSLTAALTSALGGVNN